jgi:hypothetical protein
MNKRNNEEMSNEGVSLPLSIEETRKRKAAVKSKKARERTKKKVIQMNYFFNIDWL